MSNDLRHRIDPHTHSAASDGTQAPAELVHTAAELGLGAVALTDHDTTSGWAEALAAGEALGVEVLGGIEVSAQVPRAGERPVSVHLLAHRLEPGNPALVELLQATVRGRHERMDRMAAMVAEDLGWTPQEVWAHVPAGATPGRPHIADALVAAGTVADRDEAFAGPLGRGGRYNLPHPVPAAADVLRAVREAGGVVALAHPLAALRGRSVTREEVEQMVDLGLQGIEVDHRDHDAAERELAAHWARALGLVPLGSSDYHGAGKPNRMAENTTPREVFAEFLAR